MAGILTIFRPKYRPGDRILFGSDALRPPPALFHAFLDSLTELPEGPGIGVTSVTAATKRWRDP
jgi:hypothetical protein